MARCFETHDIIAHTVVFNKYTLDLFVCETVFDCISLIRVGSKRGLTAASFWIKKGGQMTRNVNKRSGRMARNCIQKRGPNITLCFLAHSHRSS